MLVVVAGTCGFLFALLMNLFATCHGRPSRPFDRGIIEGRSRKCAGKRHQTEDGTDHADLLALQDSVKDGEFKVQASEKILRLKMNDSLLVPRGMPHSFVKTSDGDARLIVMHQPAVKMEETRIQSAIAAGRQFKSRSQYLQKGMKGIIYHEFDSIAKRITFFTDFDIVAAASAAANQQMRPFTMVNAQALPLDDLVYANVKLIGINYGALTIEKRYVTNPAHLVLRFGNNVVQPLSPGRLTGNADTSIELPISVYSFWNTKNVSILTGGPLGASSRQVELEFAFRLSDSQKKSVADVILIDGDGNHHEKKQIDLATLLHY